MTIAPQRTLCFDLDGVIVEKRDPPYDPHAKLEPCLPGAVEAINVLAEHYDIIVLTARHLHLDEIKTELIDRGLNISAVTNIKPPAIAYVDDRAVPFKDWERLAEALADHARSMPTEIIWHVRRTLIRAGVRA